MRMLPISTFRSLHSLALGAALLTACAHRAPAPEPVSLKRVEGRSCREPEELVDVLARFSTAVHAGDYHRAVALLVPEDQKRMLDAGGQVPGAIKAQLDALDFKALATDRRIDLVRGRLKGVFDCLPCLDQGEPDVAAPESDEEAAERRLAAADSAAAARLEADRAAMAKTFYRNIQQGRWQKASGLVHPSEWDVFLDREGNLSELNERRLQAIEECDLDALVLEDGLLTGLVLLLEPPLSDLYLRSRDFFDLVEADRIEEALDMVLESEKKFFRDESGYLRPDRVEKLKALDREDWRKLYLYHDVLLGVAEAAIGYSNL